MIHELRVKIIKKEGRETQLIKLSTIAKILGYSNSTPILLKAMEIHLPVVKTGKIYKVHRSDLDKLLQAILVTGN